MPDPTPQLDPLTESKPARCSRWTRLARWSIVPYWAALATATHWPGLDLGVPSGPEALFQFDKACHVVGFALLTALLIGLRPAADRHASYLALCLVAVIAYAIVDELTQHWVGRTVAFDDVLASWVGCLSVAVVVAAGEGPGASTSGEAFSIKTVRRARWAWAVLLPLGLVLATSRSVAQFAISQRHRWPEALPKLDAIAHVTGGMAMVALLLLAAPLGIKRHRANAWLMLFTLFVSAYLLEWVQGYNGREVSVTDVYHHFLGMGIGLAAWMMVTLRRAMQGERGKA